MVFIIHHQFEKKDQQFIKQLLLSLKILLFQDLSLSFGMVECVCANVSNKDSNNL